MGVGLGFPTPFANLCAKARKTTPQSTSRPPSSAPKIVFSIVIVTRVGLSGWTIGTMNSNNLRCKLFRQSPTEYPSLGSTWCMKRPSWYPSIRFDSSESRRCPSTAWRSTTAIGPGSSRRICWSTPIAPAHARAPPSSMPMGAPAVRRTASTLSLV